MLKQLTNTLIFAIFLLSASGAYAKGSIGGHTPTIDAPTFSQGLTAIESDRQEYAGRAAGPLR